MKPAHRHSLSFLVSPAYLHWLDGLVAHMGGTQARLIELGLSIVAERHGYPPAPQRCDHKPGRPRKVADEAA